MNITPQQRTFPVEPATLHIITMHLLCAQNTQLAFLTVQPADTFTQTTGTVPAVPTKF